MHTLMLSSGGKDHTWYSWNWIVVSANYEASLFKTWLRKAVSEVIKPKPMTSTEFVIIWNINTGPRARPHLKPSKKYSFGHQRKILQSTWGISGRCWRLSLKWAPLKCYFQSPTPKCHFRIGDHSWDPSAGW